MNVAVFIRSRPNIVYNYFLFTYITTPLQVKITVLIADIYNHASQSKNNFFH